MKKWIHDPITNPHPEAYLNSVGEVISQRQPIQLSQDKWSIGRINETNHSVIIESQEIFISLDTAQSVLENHQVEIEYLQQSPDHILTCCLTCHTHSGHNSPPFSKNNQAAFKTTI